MMPFGLTRTASGCGHYTGMCTCEIPGNSKRKSTSIKYPFSPTLVTKPGFSLRKNSLACILEEGDSEQVEVNKELKKKRVSFRETNLLEEHEQNLEEPTINNQNKDNLSDVEDSDEDPRKKPKISPSILRMSTPKKIDQEDKSSINQELKDDI